MLGRAVAPIDECIEPRALSRGIPRVALAQFEQARLNERISDRSPAISRLYIPRLNGSITAAHGDAHPVGLRLDEFRRD